MLIFCDLMIPTQFKNYHGLHLQNSENRMSADASKHGVIIGLTVIKLHRDNFEGVSMESHVSGVITWGKNFVWRLSGYILYVREAWSETHETRKHELFS
jgi:hypothetical protein